SAKTSSSLAPPSPGRPAVAASGKFASSGCALLTMSAATSAAALEAWPAAAALPVSGHRMPIRTLSAAAAGPGAPAIKAASIPATALARRRLPSIAFPPLQSGRSPSGRVLSHVRRAARAKGREVARRQTQPLSSRRLKHSMAANNMLYDVTILGIRPAGTPKTLPLLNEWIMANKGRGELLACWYTEIGALNRVLIIRGYADEASLGADRTALADREDRYGIGELLTAAESDTYLAFD